MASPIGWRQQDGQEEDLDQMGLRSANVLREIQMGPQISINILQPFFWGGLKLYMYRYYI